MATWTAKNRKTGQEYPGYSDEEKAKLIKTFGNKFQFIEEKSSAPAPVEAKKVRPDLTNTEEAKA